MVEAQAQADAAKLQLDERRGFKDRAIETNAKWLRLMNQVPDTPDLPSLIIELQDIAFASGVQLVAVQPADVVPLDTYTAVPVSVEILGTLGRHGRLPAVAAQARPGRAPELGQRHGRRQRTANSRAATPSCRPYAVDTKINMQAYLIPTSADRHRCHDFNGSGTVGRGTHGRQSEWRTACFAVT